MGRRSGKLLAPLNSASVRSRMFDRRRKNILELTEYGQAASLNPKSTLAFHVLFKKAKDWFLVTDETASDYASLALHLLSNPARADGEVRALRKARVKHSSR